MEVLGEAVLGLGPVNAFVATSSPLQCQILPQLSVLLVFNDFEFSANEKKGNGKANKSFLHPLHLSLISFLTFLLSLTLYLSMAGDSLPHLGCSGVWDVQLASSGHCSLQLRDIWEKISLGSHTGWQSRGLK